VVVLPAVAYLMQVNTKVLHSLSVCVWVQRSGGSFIARLDEGNPFGKYIKS
jgi:hypothetical protein